MSSRRQQGLALITAVFIVAIVATLAAYLSLGQQVWLRQAQAFLDRGKANKVSDGALQFAMLQLEEDMKKHPEADHKDEEWAIPIPPIPLDDGQVTGRIFDAQGYFNLNSLVNSDGQINNSNGIVFRNLLTRLRLDPSIADNVIAWIESANNTTGAEDIYYLTLQPPYRAANQQLTSVDELRLVRGITAEAVEVLRPHVIALPEQTPVNINTCTPEVLASLFHNPLQGSLDDLSPTIKGNVFDKKEQLKERTDVDPIADTFDVKSSYFIVRVTSKFGRLVQSRDTLVQRRAQGGPVVKWKVRKFVWPGDEEAEDDAKETPPSATTARSRIPAG